MKCFILAAALLAASAVPSFDEAVMLLTGASCMEDLDESLLERFRSLSAHPLNLNTASRSRLLSSGLLNAFQVASLLDARSRSGDIISYTELSLTDGFNEEVAAALRLFTSLESCSAPGQRRPGRLHHDFMARSSVRLGQEEDMEPAGGARYELSAGEIAEVRLGVRNTYSHHSPSWLVSTAYYGRKHLGKLVLGHFNARFGQGLTLWSGFLMQPYGSVTALRRSGTGFSATSSFAAEYCGVAADFDFGHWNAGAAYSIAGRLPMANLSYCGRSFSAGAVWAGRGAGVDFRCGTGNFGFYGELSRKEELSALGGIFWIPSYGSRLALMCRYTGGVPEMFAGVKLRNLESVGALSPSRQRCFVKYAPALVAGPVKFSPALRLAARKSEDMRLEGRGELGLQAGVAEARGRLDLVHCKSLSWLLNAEAGCRAESLKCWLRWTLFCVDNWDDRIYVYEHDVPGSFSVPAYYGRGWSLSFAGGLKIKRRHSLYWRVSYIEYPWMTSEKPSRLEGKLQYQLSL